MTADAYTLTNIKSFPVYVLDELEKPSNYNRMLQALIQSFMDHLITSTESSLNCLFMEIKEQKFCYL